MPGIRPTAAEERSQILYEHKDDLILTLSSTSYSFNVHIQHMGVAHFS